MKQVLIAILFFTFLVFLPLLDANYLKLNCYGLIFTALLITILIFNYLFKISILKKEIHLNAIFKNEENSIYKLLKGNFFTFIKSSFLSFIVSLSLLIFFYQLFINNMSIYFYIIIVFDVLFMYSLQYYLMIPLHKDLVDKAKELYFNKIIIYLNSILLITIWFIFQFTQSTTTLEFSSNLIDNTNIILSTSIEKVHHNCIYFVRLLRTYYIGDILIVNSGQINRYFQYIFIMLTLSTLAFFGISYLIKSIFGIFENDKNKKLS